MKCSAFWKGSSPGCLLCCDTQA